jgi:hypothetical protein
LVLGKLNIIPYYVDVEVDVVDAVSFFTSFFDSLFVSVFFSELLSPEEPLDDDLFDVLDVAEDFL